LKKQLILILLSPLLLSLGWPPLPTGFMLLIGFVPLFMLENEVKKGYWIKIYSSLLLWNIGTTWWVWNASPEGCIAMLLANSLLMSINFMFYRRIKKLYGIKAGLIAFVISWLSFEYLHLKWEITFPWLNLGNGLAALPNLIQWYEFTGALGGTLWILLVNCVLFYYWINRTIFLQWFTISSIAVPIIVSLLLLVFRSSPTDEKTYKAVVVQPNIDPYEKFGSMEPKEEVKYFTTLAEKYIDSTTEFLLFPETGLTENCEEDYINNSVTFFWVKEWLKKYPNLTLISGTNTYRFFDNKTTSSARKHYSGKYYDVYNSSVVADQTGVKQIYRKSKLVPGVEKMPYTNIFSFLENYAINLDGISGSLGVDSFARVFFSKNQIGAAPLICYESIYGGYTTDFVNKGANLILVLSNDGWWGNTPGYRQHKLYAGLRAIETRREVIRCTNTGTSCHIDTKGKITGETPWWETAVKTYSFQKRTDLTIYTRYGDYIGFIAAWLFSIVFLLSITPKSLRPKIFS